MILPPTYGMYEVSAEINHVGIKKVPLSDDFQINPSQIFQEADEFTKVVFICAPNNPSGNKIEKDRIVEVIEGFKGIVVVDEAYIDFCEGTGFIPFLEKYPNLVVIQTFSKAWGLASLRLGTAFASREIIGVLNKIKPPYNINGLTQEMALTALHHPEKMREMVKEILEERKWLEEGLKKINIVDNIYPSDANFLLVKVKAARKTYDYLIEEKIIVRDRSKVVLCDECLRISVGTRNENEKLLEALEKIKQ